MVLDHLKPTALNKTSGRVGSHSKSCLMDDDGQVLRSAKRPKASGGLNETTTWDDSNSTSSGEQSEAVLSRKHLDTDVKSEEDSDEKKVPMLRRTLSAKTSEEDRTRRELQEQARRLAQSRSRGDTFLQSGTDTEAEDESGGVLRHLHFGIVSVGSESENEAVVVKREDSRNTNEGSSPNWQNISFHGDETSKARVKKEELGESTLAGDLGAAAEQQNSSTSARLARDNSIRRRASNRSMKQQSTE